MHYHVTPFSRVSVLFRCNECGASDTYDGQPYCNFIRDAENDGWTFSGEDEEICRCPECPP